MNRLLPWHEACFNNISPPRWNLPLGAALASRGDLCPLGILFTPSCITRGEHSLMFRRMMGQTEGLHPWGITSALGANFTPGVQISTLGEKIKLASWSGQASCFWSIFADDEAATKKSKQSFNILPDASRIFSWPRKNDFPMFSPI
jgi:hypothetical protein